jgi:hypothetical protein
MAIVIVVALLNEDITKKDIKLHKTEEKFRSVTDSTVDGIIKTDTDSKIVLFMLV